jgi:predicted chitinase
MDINKKSITKVVNGGDNGLSERQKYLMRLKRCGI